MRLKGLVEYDICNYRIPSMFLIFPFCSFKCDHECGQEVCQNSSLAHEPIIEIEIIDVIHRYLDNPLTHAVVCGGMEPFDTFGELYTFITLFRAFSSDTIVIYTGYNEEEIQDKIKLLQKLPNIIVKYGRFIPNSPHIFDTVLGVKLASDNQYAKYIDEEMYKREYISNNSGEN